MKILFKDDDYVYYISNGKIELGAIYGFPDIDLTNIPHLDNAEVLYHYKDKIDGRIYHVYYEYGNRAIVCSPHTINRYTWIQLYPHHIKDHTLINLKLLEDENII